MCVRAVCEHSSPLRDGSAGVKKDLGAVVTVQSFPARSFFLGEPLIFPHFPRIFPRKAPRG